MKRSAQIGLVVMGALGTTTAAGYLATNRDRACETAAANNPQAAPGQECRRSIWGHGGHGYSGYHSFFGGSPSSATPSATASHGSPGATAGRGGFGGHGGGHGGGGSGS
jgi:hypothetical protein